MIEAVLFDLDGTFIDTATDMGTALNNLLLEENLSTIPLQDIRPFVSQGGLVLTKMGFDKHVGEHEIEPLRQRYLQHYYEIIAEQSTLFDGISEILDVLKIRQIKWGIVTNKPEWLTSPLLEQLRLDCPVVICGDTLSERKPHPLPLQVAAQKLKVNCENCIYVGDDERDIIAGRAANMKTLIAAYGYIEPNVNLHDWQADGIIQQPMDLLRHPFLN